MAPTAQGCGWSCLGFAEPDRWEATAPPCTHFDSSRPKQPTIFLGQNSTSIHRATLAEVDCAAYAASQSAF
jgi:hypothetical protein